MAKGEPVEYGQQIFVSEQTRCSADIDLIAFLIGATATAARRDGYEPVVGSAKVSWPDEPFRIAPGVCTAVVHMLVIRAEGV